jgi:integrase/recombinase XerD
MIAKTPLAKRMLEDLQLAGFSPTTQTVYFQAVRALARHFNVSPDKITEEQLRQYFLFVKNEKRWASGTMRVALFGIRFFYSRTVKRDWLTLRNLRIPKERKLPAVMSISEVRQLITSVKTVHNRVFFQTLYSLGLRVQEGLHLQLGDIDKNRMLVHVHHGKGAKDRYVPLPDATLALLRTYWKTHRNPTWIFPSLGRDYKKGPTAAFPMVASGRMACLQEAIKRLGWKKRGITLHTFRHSYATHLLEGGSNPRVIQKYLGHDSLNTTMLYFNLTSHGEEQALAIINHLMTWN